MARAISGVFPQPKTKPEQAITAERRGKDDDYPEINAFGRKFLFEEESVDSGDEHNQHRDQVSSEQLAE